MVNQVPNPTGRPKFIIKYGPSASGKGSAAVRRVIEGFGDPITSYINIGVDDVVESSQAFKNMSHAVIQKLVTSPSPKKFNNFLEHATINQVPTKNHQPNHVFFLLLRYLQIWQRV